MQKLDNTQLCCFPKRTRGTIVGYKNDGLKMPGKVMEIGLLPDTKFTILHQAPFRGPLYVEYGEERTRVALREEEAAFITVVKDADESK